MPPAPALAEVVMGSTVHSMTEIENMRIAVYGTVTISSGKGISDAEVLDGHAVVRIYTDANWKAASAPTLSLAVSEDGTTYRQLRVWQPSTPTTTVVGAITANTSQAYAIPPEWTDGAHSVKVVSGTVATTTPLVKNRTVGLVYRLV
jgi:hypothetical protein